MGKNVSIGIFAHNEADGIQAMLREFRRQTVFAQPEPPQLVLLENGSADNTAALGDEVLKTDFAGLPARVVSLEIGDKGNTWNEFVHRISPPETDVLVFVDADIELGHERTLENLLAGLEAFPEAHVAVSRPLKDIAKKDNLSRAEKLSLSASEAAYAGPARLAGSLYCGYADLLRQIVIPRGLLVEDGFIRAMVLTSRFSEPENVNRMITSADTFHYFEAVTQLAPLFRHERRLAIGTELNIMLFYWLEQLQKEGKDPLAEIKTRNDRQPDWVRDMALEQLKAGTFQFHLNDYLFKQWRAWKQHALKKKITTFPGLAVRLALNTAVAVSAQKGLKRGVWQW